MKKIKAALALLLIFSIFSLCATGADAQTKVIKKTVKKVVTPEIAPAQPPKVEATPEAVSEEVPPPPPPPPTYMEQLPKEDEGVFGWGLNTDIGAKLLAGSILFGTRGDLVFADPLQIGGKLGLAQDAVEYKLGSGFVISDKLKSIPLFADAVVYFKEGAMFGMDPYAGAGLIYNLYGTGQSMGGLGGQAYFGILADLGFASGKTGIALGYATYQVANNVSDSGIFITAAQPLKL